VICHTSQLFASESQVTPNQIFSIAMSCSLVPSAHQFVPILAPRNCMCSAQNACTTCNPQICAILISLKDFLNLLNVGPLPELYLHLIPPRKKTIKKEGVNKHLKKLPLIHCMADEEFLFKYAHNQGLLRECPGERKGEMVLLKLVTMTATVKAIFTELRLSSIPVRLPQVVTNDDVILIIALYNNYSMNKRPTDKDFWKLAGFLGKEGEQPNWYFDVTRWKWN
jgi:hypothetical protein